MLICNLKLKHATGTRRNLYTVTASVSGLIGFILSYKLGRKEIRSPETFLPPSERSGYYTPGIISAFTHVWFLVRINSRITDRTVRYLMRFLCHGRNGLCSSTSFLAHILIHLVAMLIVETFGPYNNITIWLLSVGEKYIQLPSRYRHLPKISTVDPSEYEHKGKLWFEILFTAQFSGGIDDNVHDSMTSINDPAKIVFRNARTLRIPNQSTEYYFDGHIRLISVKIKDNTWCWG